MKHADRRYPLLQDLVEFPHQILFHSSDVQFLRRLESLQAQYSRESPLSPLMPWNKVTRANT